MHPDSPTQRLRVLATVTLLLALLALATGPAMANDWTQWGGPNADFSTSGEGLVTSWPEDGPPVLWRRTISDHGHAAILYEAGTLYTFVRRGDDDVALALDAASGETKWEQVHASPLPEGYNRQFGPGPHATPLIAGERMFTISSLTRIQALDKQTGELLWAHDLMQTMGAPMMGRGYGASPVAWGDLVIAVVGGEGQGVVAFRQADGEVVWKALDGQGGYVTPRIAEIDGVPQVLVSLGATRAGLDPATGEVLWTLELRPESYTTMAPLFVVGDGEVFSSSAYADGSRVVKVTRAGDGWKAEEAWYSNKFQLMHQTAARFGDLVYGSSGDFGPAFLAAIDVNDGEIAFRQRGFAKANLMRVGDRVLILDEDGKLALGQPKADGIEILAEAEVLAGTAWTVPTLVGTRLFVRNREEIVALQLGDL